MTATCPNGHSSTADDYCDVCGAPIDASAQPAAPMPSAPPSVSPPVRAAADAASPTMVPCPHCGVQNAAEALFCEACGYDFTTGTLPRTPGANPLDVPEPGAAAADVVPEATAAPDATAPPAPPTASPAVELTWVAEVWVDPDWYAQQESTDPMPSPGLPTIVPLRTASVLVGRTSKSRGISPDIACESDTGISRRQAQLTTDGTRWFVEDLDSANGTYVAPADGPVPADPIPVGRKTELDPDDRVYLGAWTRIVVRAATEDEQQTL